MRFEHAREALTGELATLIGVEYLRVAVLLQGFFKTVYTERRAQRDYDVQGLRGFVVPVAGRSKKWFCSEACAAALGYSDPWRFSPAILHAALLPSPVENVATNLAD